MKSSRLRIYQGKIGLEKHFEVMEKKLSIGNGMSKKFLVGSQYFFGDMPDFESKDCDYVVFVDEPLMFRDVMNIKGGKNKNDDVFFWCKMSPEEFVKVTIKSGTPMQIGKFLVKEAARYLNFNINHLKKFSKFIKYMDKEHMYEKVIFDFYIENNAFFLTDKQKEIAYEAYKKGKEEE